MKKIVSLMLLSNLIGLPNIEAQGVETEMITQTEEKVKESLEIKSVIAIKVFHENEIYTLLLDSTDFNMVTKNSDNFVAGTFYDVALNEDYEVRSIEINENKNLDSEELGLLYPTIFDILNTFNLEALNIFDYMNNYSFNNI